MASREPQDLAAERYVLGAMLQSPSAIGDVSAVISSADYYRPAHQLVHEAILRLHGRNDPADAIAVADELRRCRQLQKIGGEPGLHDLLAACAVPVQAPYYARIVAEHARRRRLIETGTRIRQMAAGDGVELGEIEQLIREQLAAIAEQASSAAAATYQHRLILTPASQIEPRPVRWGWEGRMPAGHLSLIPGREGIGKSLLLTWLIAQVTRGTLPGVYQGRPRPVFYTATEDSWQHTIAPRLIAAGADLDLVYRIEVESVETSMRIELTMPRDCDLMAAEVKRLGVAMLALDPLMSVVDRAVDTYNDREMRTVLEPLGKLADDTGCMIAGLAHFNKSTSDDPLTLVTGSRAFTAVVRSVVAVARDPDADDGGCVVSQVKNNLGRLDLPNLRYVIRPAIVETAEGEAQVGKLTWDGESARSVREILADTGDHTERTERVECAEWLAELLSAGPMRTNDVKAEAKGQWSDRTLERARGKARVRAYQQPSGPKGRNEWWLELPDDADRQDRP